MKAVFQHRHQRDGFTLLEVVVVLFIVALVLAAVHSIAQGAITLADDVRRAQRSESRQQAFTNFCEHLFTTLPATSTVKLRTTQDSGQYLIKLELENTPSPFDGSPECLVTLLTEPLPGGGMRLLLSCRKKAVEADVRVVLLDDLLLCEWRAFDPATRQWTTVWDAPAHPTLMELSVTQASDSRRRIFWIVPSEPPAMPTPKLPTG